MISSNADTVGAWGRSETWCVRQRRVTSTTKRIIILQHSKLATTATKHTRLDQATQSL
jgi:hypothetical protein